MNSRSVATAATFVACVSPACATGAGFAASAAAQPAGSSVRLAGCVVNSYYVPHAGAVILRSRDGRLIGRTLTDADGIFVVRVPSRERIDLTLDGPGADATSSTVGVQDAVLEACLRIDAD
jgi:hypothetical protein